MSRPGYAEYATSTKNGARRPRFHLQLTDVRLEAVVQANREDVGVVAGAVHAVTLVEVLVSRAVQDISLGTLAEVVVEADLEISEDEEFTTIFSAVLPPDVTEMTVPEEFLEQTDEYKYEVLARAENWNQTATESCFLLEDEDDGE